jgi:hypothetical protein
MATHDEQIDIKETETQLSADDLARVNDAQADDQTSKSKHDRNKRLLILLMLLMATQVIVLLANSGFVNRAPDPIVAQPPVTLTDIKEVETDLKKVIENLNAINRNPDLKDDHVEVKKVEPKIVPVVPAPVAVKPKKVNKQPEKVALKVEEPVIVPPVTVKAVSQVIDKPVYIKHDMSGQSLDDNKEQWACVQDTETGLMWEVKSENDAMRNRDNLYSWFDPEMKAVKGKPDGGRCKGSADCDTHAYIEAMNKQNYCGHNDWRLPTREQMQTLVDFEGGDVNTKIDNQYFPRTMPSWYWTSSEHNKQNDYAWYVLFRNGHALSDLKERPKHIRLVRIADTNISSN